MALADRIERLRPDLPIVVGGPHATTLPETIMQRESIDYTLAGEGETILPKLVESLAQRSPPPSLPGLYSRKNGRVSGTPPRIPDFDLDGLPFADRKLFRSVFPGLAGIHMVTSRYCPNHCAYCQNNALRRVYGKRPLVRRFTPERVVEEVISAQKDFLVPSVRFFDELFSSDSEWLSGFVAPYREKVGIPFHCAVSPKTVTQETAHLLSQAGCYEVQMGVQILREDIKKELLQRPETIKQVREAIQLLKSHGIRTGLDLILGIPGVTEHDLEDTARFFSKNKPTRLNLYWLQPVPGTDMTDHLHKIGWLSDEGRDRIHQGEDASGYFLGGRVFQTQKRLLPYEWLIATAVHRSPEAVERSIRRGWFRKLPAWIPPHLLWLVHSLRTKHPNDTMAIRTRNRYITFLGRKLLSLGKRKKPSHFER